jgi:hypothetical protein
MGGPSSLERERVVKNWKMRERVGRERRREGECREVNDA